MDPFYIELKKLREKNNIDLAEIHNRTKIDITYLEALEEGRFEILPRTYLRLFLRAYVTEIGGDTKDALNQLDHHLSSVEGIEITPESTAPEQPDFTESDIIAPSRKPPKKMVSDIVKGGALIIVVLFAIFIIKNISNKESEAIGGQPTLRVDETVDAVTNEELIFDYTRLAEWNESFDAEPPFFIRIMSDNNLWYQLIVDETDTLSGVLAHGRDISTQFGTSVNLLTNSAEGVSVKINGIAVQNMGTHPDPVELTFETDPNRVNIIHYTPNK